MKTNELLIITLAIIILIATYITIDPSITGLVIVQPNFQINENILINQTIQLKQFSITTNTTTKEYFTPTEAKKLENLTIETDELPNLIQLDNESTNLGKEDSLNIKFNNNINQINLYLKSNQEPILNINNNSIPYTKEGFYQLDLQTSELTITTDSIIKINYINASKEITTQSINYYYIPTKIESETLEKKNWDLFTTNYNLNNQTLKFFYKVNQTYNEFTPPYNFSEINSNLQFKIFLNSDNISTPIIYNLSINYIEETQEEPTPIPTQAPSLTRYSSPTPSTTSKTETKQEAPKIETKTISQPIQLKTTPEPIDIQPKENIQIKEVNKQKIIANTIALSYLAFICLLLYKRRHKL